MCGDRSYVHVTVFDPDCQTAPLRLISALVHSSPSAATCLVNNLDLTVQASGLAGYTLYGNGEPDSLNNVERVRLGHWAVQLRSHLALLD